LLFVSWILPHSPYKAPPGYVEHFKDIKLPPNVPVGAATELAENNLPDYYGMIESLDDEFKRILQALDQAGVAKDTIVVYSSDHGDMIGCQGYKAKRWPYEESARIPFLIRYPKAIPAGTVIADPFGATDVYPTLAGLAGVPVPSGLDGVDFSNLFKGETSKPPRDYVYLEMQYAYVPWPGWRALRTRRYMYARLKERPWLLFDLENDPWEMNNLVEDPGKHALVKELNERLEKIMRETGDSWEIKAADGDLKNWMPGGSKQRSQDLGTDWPGKGNLLNTGKPTKEKKSKGKRAKP
jgi:arylsulfatase A-like enzyme